MNRNLPQVVHEGFFTKIKNWFNNFFRKQKSIEYPIQESLNELHNKMDENSKENFVQDIKVENKDNILKLQRKIKENEIGISDLTDQELDEIIQKFNESKITCYDFHCGNVIINGNGINIIDTDQYAFEEERPAINNFRFFFSHIFNEIFDIGYYFMPDENFRFYSKYITSLYEKYLYVKNELNSNYGDEKEKQRKLDLLKYQLNEIQEAQLK